MPRTNHHESEINLVMCCFCGDDIKYSSAVQLTIQLSDYIDERQGVYCHPECLDNVLHSSIPRHPDLLGKEL